MADATVQMYYDRYINVLNGPSATMLVLPTALGITKNATVTIEEVDSLDVPTGRYIKGIVAAVASGQFYNLPINQNQFYLNPLDMAPWIDYSSASTVVGWSSFVNKEISYQLNGNTLFFRAFLYGTSNSTSISFTLPFAATSDISYNSFTLLGYNNGVLLDVPSLAVIAASSNIVNVYRSNTSHLWTATGAKYITMSGFFRYL